MQTDSLTTLKPTHPEVRLTLTRRWAHPAASFLATLLMGLMAGFFFAFAVDVAPAMAHLDAQTYIEVQQWINRVVRSAGFGAVYFGALWIGFVAGAAAWGAGHRREACAWWVLACVWAVAVFWITRSINIPLNDALATWNPKLPPDNWRGARDTWNQANAWRAWASAACFCAVLMLSMGALRKRTPD